MSGSKAENVSAGASVFTSGLLNNACSEEHGGCWTTDKERAKLAEGDYLGYYAEACQSGDEYACYARGIAAEEWGWGWTTTKFMQAHSYVWRWRGVSSNEMREIRIDLASSYADLFTNDMNKSKWPTENEIKKFHWEVFGKHKLPNSAFGGTPFFGYGAAPTRFLTEWCPNCTQE